LPMAPLFRFCAPKLAARIRVDRLEDIPGGQGVEN
jgi:hypothetical protein